MTGVAPAVERLPHERQQLIDRLCPRRHAIYRVAVRALDDQDVGARQFGPLGRGRLAQLEVAAIEQRSLAVFGQQHGRAQAVAGRIGGQPQAAPLQRLAIGQIVRRPRSVAKLIELGRWPACTAHTRAAPCDRCGRATRTLAADAGENRSPDRPASVSIRGRNGTKARGCSRGCCGRGGIRLIA